MIKFQLVVGDWSRDGHNETEDFIIESTLPDHTYFNNGIALACATYDIVLRNSWGDNSIGYCEDYDDPKIPLELLQKIGYDLDTLENVPTNDMVYISPEDWVRIHIHLVHKAYPDYESHIINFPTYRIGGYGLFSM